MTAWDDIDDEPRAEVQQIGRWTYRVSVIHGICSWGPDGYGWHVLGRRRAARKARKALARYLRQEVRRSVVAYYPDDGESP